jgi:tetratricopeptide (TPR) repeat protein
VLERACYYSPDDSSLWDLRVQASETTEQEEAAQRELARRFPDKPEYALSLGRVLVSLGKQDDARKVLRPLTEKGPVVGRAKAHYELARSHYRKDELNEALGELDAARSLDPATVTTLRAFVLRGQILEELKRPKDAANAYRLALAVEKRSQEVLLSLIRLSIAAKDEMAALDYLRQYTLAAGRDVSGLLLAANAYLKLKRYDDAFELATRARDIAFHEKAQRILGLVYLHRGDDAKALAHLQKAEFDGTVAAGLIRASINVGKLGDLEAVLEKGRRVEKPTEGLQAACERARNLLRLRAEIGKQVSVPPGKAAEWSAALDGVVCAMEAQRRGEPAAKIEGLLAAAFKPGLAIGQAYGLRARLELQRGKLTKALADATRAIELSPADAAGYFVRGRVRQERGVAGAVADLEKAAELSARQDPDVLQALASACAAAGKLEAALVAARAAVKLRPKDHELLEQLSALEKSAREKGER